MRRPLVAEVAPEHNRVNRPGQHVGRGVDDRDRERNKWRSELQAVRGKRKCYNKEGTPHPFVERCLEKRKEVQAQHGYMDSSKILHPKSEGDGDACAIMEEIILVRLSSYSRNECTPGDSCSIGA